MDDFCCSNCFNPKRDRFHSFIREFGFASDEPCPYCKSDSGIKIDTDKLGIFIKMGIDRAYDDTVPCDKTAERVDHLTGVPLRQDETRRRHVQNKTIAFVF